MVTSKIESVAYSNGKRIETVVFECSLSDDYVKMGQLQTSLGQRLAKKEQISSLYESAEGETKKAYDSTLDELDKEINVCYELLAIQQKNIDGYTQAKENK